MLHSGLAERKYWSKSIDGDTGPAAGDREVEGPAIGKHEAEGPDTEDGVEGPAAAATRLIALLLFGTECSV